MIRVLFGILEDCFGDVLGAFGIAGQQDVRRDFSQGSFDMYGHGSSVQALHKNPLYLCNHPKIARER